MHLLSNAVRSAALAAFVAVAAGGAALASDNKIALIPGGPHPYFAPWEQAAADAKKDFGIAVGRIQSADRLEARPADRTARKPGLAGLQRLRHLPRRCGRHQFDRRGAQGPSIPVASRSAAARRIRPTWCFCFATDVYKSAYTDQGADQGDGRQGQHRPPHRPPDRPQHHAARAGGRRRRSTRPTAR